MDIKKTLNGNDMVVALEGRLDSAAAPGLDASLAENLQSVDSMVLDLEKVEYISSAGLRSLLTAHKALAGKGGLKIRNANEIVKEVFDVTGFSDILTIE